MPPAADPNEGLRNSIAAGLCLIALGLGLFLQGGLALSSLWPYLPLAIGVAHFTRPDLRDGGRRSLRSATWWMFVGAWGLGNVHRVFGMRYTETWPILLVVGGAMLVWESLSPEPAHEGPGRGPVRDDEERSE